MPVYPARGRWSMLAIAGFVLALFACCPPISLLGSVFGAMALQRIAQSHGILRGRRLAMTAAILGLCLGVAGFAAWWKFNSTMQQWTQDTASRGVHDFIEAAQKGDAKAARSLWIADRSSAPDDQTFLDFGKSATERFGALRSFSVTSVTAAVSGPFAATFEMAGTFSFERGDRPGAAAFIRAPALGHFMPQLRLKQITIDDGERGDLVLPSTAAATQATTQRGGG